MNKHILKCLIPCMLFLSSCSSSPSKEAEASDTPDPSKEAPVLFYQGRIDNSNGSAPVIIWQGTTIQTKLSGESLKIGFSNLNGQVYFDLEVDGQVARLTAKNGWINSPIPLTQGIHDVRVFKRSEADVGYVSFLGFKTTTATGETTIFNAPDTTAINPNNYERKFLFYGDSITAGACNEDSGDDQWEDYSTHNNALSYGALTAEAVKAEYRNISVSGMGITMGYNKLLFKEVWDRTYADKSSTKVNFNQWQPDVIFINYGENDDSYSTSQNQTFPSNFTSEYVSVVRKIRGAYPNSTIVILRGGMYGGSQSQRLRGPWESAMNTLTAEDNNIKHFVFNHWSSKHPRVSDHRAMADELSKWVKANLL